jgi:hypothetical protein
MRLGVTLRTPQLCPNPAGNSVTSGRRAHVGSQHPCRGPASSPGDDRHAGVTGDVPVHQVPPMAAVNQRKVRMVRTAHPASLNQLSHRTGKAQHAQRHAVAGRRSSAGGPLPAHGPYGQPDRGGRKHAAGVHGQDGRRRYRARHAAGQRPGGGRGRQGPVHRGSTRGPPGSPFCVARILDAGIEGGDPYLVAEYVPGPTLTEAVGSDGPLPQRSLEAFAIGTATGLMAIHQTGLVHGELGPEHVMLGPDGPRVTHFGITPPYGAATPAADVLAWANTVLFAAVGRRPGGAPGSCGTRRRRARGPGSVPGARRGQQAGGPGRADPAPRPARSLIRPASRGEQPRQGGRQAARTQPARPAASSDQVPFRRRAVGRGLCGMRARVRGGGGVHLPPDSAKGTIAYPGLGCSGRLDIVSVARDRLTLDQTISSGRKNCPDGVITLVSGPAGTAAFTFLRPGGGNPTGTLTRRA